MMEVQCVVVRDLADYNKYPDVRPGDVIPVHSEKTRHMGNCIECGAAGPLGFFCHVCHEDFGLRPHWKCVVVQFRAGSPRLEENHKHLMLYFIKR